MGEQDARKQFVVVLHYLVVVRNCMHVLAQHIWLYLHGWGK